MPAIDYFYDPTASSPANKVGNEIQPVDISVSRAVFPLHGPFYKKDLKVEGKLGGGAWTEIKEHEDFLFSPMFMSVAAATGTETFTFFVLLEAWDQVRITYQVVGKYEDTKLLSEITARTIDRTNLHDWTKLNGSASFIGNVTRDPSIQDNSLLEVLTDQLVKLRQAIANPWTSDDNSGLVLSELQQQVGELSDAVSGLTGEATDPKPVLGGNEALIYESPEFTDASTIYVTYIATDNTVVETLGLNLLRLGTLTDFSTFGHISNNGANNLVFTTEVAADKLIVKVTTPTDGKVIINTAAEH